MEKTSSRTASGRPQRRPGTAMVSAIIVTHGRLAQELIDTAGTIFGDTSGCYAVTNAQKSPGALREELDQLLAEHPDDRFIVFVDFFGGSCCHTCMGLAREHEEVHLITGVNLPMLLAFLYKRGEIPFDKLPAELATRGSDSVRIVDMEDE